MSAFKAVKKLGVEAVELDVRLTRDEEPVIIHDNDIRRTTKGKGYVSDYTLQELKKYRLKESRDQYIPTFNETLELIADDVEIAIDPKEDQRGLEKLLSKIKPVLLRYDTDKFWLQIQEKKLDSIRTYFPTLRCCNLSRNIGSPVEYINRSLKKGFDFIEPSFGMLNEEFVETAHNKNLKIILPHNAHKNGMNLLPTLFELSVDWILTDFPEQVIAFLK